jgi:hypothetical protein
MPKTNFSGRQMTSATGLPTALQAEQISDNFTPFDLEVAA